MLYAFEARLFADNGGPTNSNSAISPTDIALTPTTAGRVNPMKKLLICLDGTWNEAGSGTAPDDTNVIRLFRSAQHVKSPGQPAFCFQGVGSKTFENLRGGIPGYGLFEQVKDACLEIVNNSQPGDRIFIAGFSRSAFSARCLASFITRCGVLKNHFFDVADLRDKRAIDQLWDLYTQRSSYGRELADFCSTHCQTPVGPSVEAVAVRDTVGLLGIPWEIFDQNVAVELLSSVNAGKDSFLESDLSPAIPRAWHALALDEQRVPFAPTLFAGPRVSDGFILQVWFAGNYQVAANGTGGPAALWKHPSCSGQAQGSKGFSGLFDAPADGGHGEGGRHECGGAVDLSAAFTGVG
ncbi:MAG: phospholipase effector Tle1 domain-containing protein [Planctomycetota bacterium]